MIFWYTEKDWLLQNMDTLPRHFSSNKIRLEIIVHSVRYWTLYIDNHLIDGVIVIIYCWRMRRRQTVCPSVEQGWRHCISSSNCNEGPETGFPKMTGDRLVKDLMPSKPLQLQTGWKNFYACDYYAPAKNQSWIYAFAEMPPMTMTAALRTLPAPKKWISASDQIRPG